MPNRQPWDIKLEQLELVLSESTAGFLKIGKLMMEFYVALKAAMDEIEDLRVRLANAEQKLAGLTSTGGN